MDEFAVEIALDASSLELDLDVVPAAGFDGAVDFGHGESIGFETVPAIAPAADVPPGFLGLVLLVEEDQEAFRAAQFARLESQSAVAPFPFVGDERLGAFDVGILPQDAVHDLPVAAAGEFPAGGILGQIDGQQGFIAAGDLDVLELGLGHPGADPDAAADVRRRGRRRDDIGGQDDGALVLAEHFLHVVGGDAVDA